MHSNKLPFPCCFVTFHRSATSRLNFRKDNAAVYGDDKKFAVNGTLTAESVPPIDIHHVGRLFMETFVWTTAACNVELNVSAMQTSDMTAE